MVYIIIFIVPYQPVRVPRSSDELEPLHSEIVRFAPAFWNSLPLDIRCCDSLHSFKSVLKTHIPYMIRCIIDTQVCSTMYFNCFILYVFFSVFSVCASK